MNAKNILLGLCAVATLASCQKKDLEIPQGDNTKGSSPVFTSGAATKAGGNQWTPGDKVGIYMVKGGQTLAEENIVSGAKNISHLVSNLSEDRTSCKFNPVNGSEKILFPSDGSTVDFVAYYPYKDGMGLNYTINLSDQSNLEAIDFMIAKTPGKSSSDAVVPLTFSHGLSRLDIIATPVDGEDLTGATVTISGLPLKGVLNLADGTITKDISSVKDITVPLNADAKVTVLLMPYTKEEALSGTITLKTKNGTVKTFKLRPEMMQPGRTYTQELRDQFFPDADFRHALVTRYYFTEKDDDIDPYQENNKKLINDMRNMSVDNSDISSLDGIEYFTNLEYFSCEDNRLVEIDLSDNKKLRGISCQSNKLTTLNLPQSIRDIYCSYNKLTKLDWSDYKELYLVSCENNQLTKLDISSNKLVYLCCSNNNLTELDVSGCSVLKELYCQNNELQSLKLASDSYVEIKCDNNKLSSLDLSKCINLRRLECKANDLTSLDVSKNHKLIWFDCRNNKLTDLDITALQYILYDLNVLFCGNQKDNITLNLTLDVNQARRWYYFKHDTGSENKNVRLSEVRMNFADYNFRQLLIKQGFVEENNDIDPENPVNKTLFSKIQDLDVSKQDILSLKGIEYFVDLTSLDCSGNRIDSLDVSNNKILTNLNCSKNQLRILNLPQNLFSLNCSNNSRLSVLDVSKNTTLRILDCSYSGLSSMLGISNNTELRTLDCSYNKLSMLDISSNTELETLYCSSNKLKSLNLSHNLQLTKLTCHLNQLAGLDITMLPKLDVMNLVCGRQDLPPYTPPIILQITSEQLPAWDIAKNNSSNSDVLAVVK